MTLTRTINTKHNFNQYSITFLNAPLGVGDMKYTELLKYEPKLAVYFEGITYEEDILIDVQAFKIPLSRKDELQINALGNLFFEVVKTENYWYAYKVASHMGKSKCCNAIVTSWSVGLGHKKCICESCEQPSEYYYRELRAEEEIEAKNEIINEEIKRLQTSIRKATAEIQELQLLIAA